MQVLPREESELGMDCLRLVKALPALYPKDSEEKKFWDAVLLGMPGQEQRDRRLGMTITERIEINPKVMMGKPVIRVTQITVEFILSKINEGPSEADL